MGLGDEQVIRQVHEARLALTPGGRNRAWAYRSAGQLKVTVQRVLPIWYVVYFAG